MKRITALLIAILFVIAFSACAEETEQESSDTGELYPSRTAAFYGNMDMNSFWFTMEFTNYGTTYTMTQATNGKAVTTIEDHEDNTLDQYQIYDNKSVHKLNLQRKSYDTVLGSNGQGFLFEGYTPSMFANPSSSTVQQFEGESYYCESFVTAGSAGRNNYYFDENRLAVIEIIEGGKTVMVMRITDYSNTIPSDVYLSIPEDFKGGNLEFEHPDISYDDGWGDNISYGS